MATSILHQAVAQIARDKPGLVISAEMLKELALDSLSRSASVGRNAGITIPTGHRAVVGKFLNISLNPATLGVKLVSQGTDLLLEISPGFSVELELLEPVGDIAYSNVNIDVPIVSIFLRAGNNSIKFTTPETAVTATVVDGPKRQSAIQASGISQEDLLRVEGAFSFGGTSTSLIRSALGELPPIDLERLFPAFRFGGDLALSATNDSLLIIPERFEFLGNTGCPKGDATNGMEVNPQNPAIGADGGNWPVLVGLPHAAPPRRPLEVDGLVSAYLPKPVLDSQFGKVAPAITYKDHGDGFIGYDVELSAAIRRVDVSIDVVNIALRLELSFASWGFVNASIDVPCVGRVELAQAHLELPKENGTATLSALVRLGVDTAGRLLMLTEIEGIDLGEAEVSIQLFSKYLGMAGGKAAVIGFLTDAIIGRVIANNLPGLIFDAIKDAVNQHFFVLANLSDLLTHFRNAPNRSTWSDDQHSVLMGLTSAER
jgi:hypothetical protein